MTNKSNRFNLWQFLTVLILLSLGLHATAQTQNWTLIWSDNFAGPAGSAPNPNNWTLQQGLTSDGAQSYNCLYGQTTDGCNPATPNVYLDGNNHLIIQALAAAGAPNGVTTGRLFTTNSANTVDLFSTQYGRIEAEMVLPAGSGNQGVWPAFWMLGTNIPAVNWPSCGEMDIMEYVGAANETQVYSTLHGQAYADEGLGVRDTLSGGWSGTHIFGAIWSPNQISFYVDNITNIYGTISTADIMANQSWDNGGLSAWPFNNPMFIIFDLNMGGPFPGNVSAATTYPQVLQVNYVNVYQATAPAPPTGVTATATSQSQVALNWTGSTSSDVTYNVYRSSVSGVAPLSQAQPNAAVLPQTNQTLIANNITGTSYTDANLSPGQTYYYTVTGSGEYSGESAASQVAVTLPTSGVGTNGGAIYVSAGGYSGAGNYIVNTLVSGGFTNAFTATVNTGNVTNPAPQDVYHSERWGPQSWTIAHLTPGGSYNVRMHFAESAWTAAGQREFNVLINGQQVLTNFDIFATAGAQNTVVTQAINTIADRNGVILLQLAVGADDQPEIRALDVTPSTGGTAMGAAAGTTTYVAIDAGGPGGETAATGTFEADADAGTFGLPANPITAGGATNTTTQAINTTGVTNPAPEAVYETERYGAFGYIFTGLVANSTYTIRLHLAEGVADYNAAGMREFNVVVNGNQVLTNYDIYANAGALYQAVIPQLTGVSDEHGILSVQFTRGYDDLPSVRGIEITQSSSTPVAATPAFSPAAGTYTSAQTVTISDSTAGATIYYTTNGTTPTTASAVYSGAISVGASETIEAIATASGYTTSAVGTAAYTINITLPAAATPTFSPAAGTYTSAQSVTISDATSGATIYYTTNGTTPTTGSTVYSGAISVGVSETIEAIATASGHSTSATGTAAYTINLGSGTDVLDINAGGTATGSYVADVDFAGGTASTSTNTVSTTGVTNPAPEAVYQTQRFGNFTYTLPDFTAGASYTVRLHFAETYWTAAGSRLANVMINGTQVLTSFDIFTAAGGQNKAVVEQFSATATSAGQIVVQFVTVKDNAAVNGIEIETSSALPTAATPAFSPAAGTYTSAQTVTISDATAGATIYYTTNGTTPTTASTVYSGAISVGASETIEAIATASGYTTSAAGTAAYTINITLPTAATPTFSPAAGTYTSAQTVTISDSTTGAKIYYTTNGTTPITASALYSAPITVSATETVEAIAAASGYNNSTVGTAAYTITTTSEGPYGGTPAAIPGTVLAENYDTGGQGVGYDVAAVNGTANTYRSDGVDLEAASAPATGNDIGWTAAGQWFRYTVNVATAGTYTVSFLVAAPTAVTDGFHLSNSSGTNLSGSVNVPATGGYQTWVTVTATVTLPAGKQTLTLNQDAAGWNIDSAAFVLTTPSGTDILDISAGGPAAGSYVADEDFVGGTASATANTISTTGVTNPAPESVYQHQRYGNFTYTLPGFTAGATYPVRLHFDEFYWTAAGKREFNVLINGTQVLTDFDVFATAGGENIAVVEQFNAVANSSGQIVIQFVSVVDNAEINGIEVEN
jgi:beta-glucanase (GH16 family)